MKNKVIAIALALTTLAWVAPINGATVEELQAQINALLQQIAQLQAQLAAQGGSTATGCFTKTLQKGMSDPEVTTLQQVLKTDSSIYPEGLVTGYFGSLTEAAVKKFQAKYGLDQVGIVGPATRAKLNSLYCGTAQQTTTTTPTTTPTTAAYGTLSVQSYPVSNPQTTLYGGNTYELVAAQYKATGSDIIVKKVAIKVTDVDGADSFPWQAFTTFSLWEGNTKLAEISASQANAIENTFADEYTYNIAGLNWVVPNGQTKVLTVKATVVSGIPVALNNETFSFTLLHEGVVYSDTAGVVYTSASGNDLTSQTLTITTAQTASVTLAIAADNPVDYNIVGSTTGTTRADLMKFNLKTENVNATLNSATGLIVTIGSTSTQSYITAVELWDGSTLIQSAAPVFSNGDDTTGTVTWSNFTLPVAAGTTKVLTVRAQIAQLPTNYTGDTSKYFQITAGPTFSGIDANSNVVNSTGSVTGNKAYLFTKAPTFAFGSAQFTSSGDTSHPQSIGNAKITFSVTANGNSDIYLSNNSTYTTAKYFMGGVETSTPALATGFTCTSGAYTDTNGFRIPAGGTANCELSATLQLTTTTAGAYYQVQLSKVGWSLASQATPDITQTWGWDNFKTGLLYLAY